jgi:TP901 family phage tail tape measure protein
MGAVAVKTMADATKHAAAFEKQMSNVSTLLDGDVKKRIGELGKEVIKVSNKTGVATADLTDGLYQVISAIGDCKDATDIVAIAAKAAKAGNATTTDSVALLTAVTKGYGDTSKEAMQKASDLAFQTVKLGQTDFPSLASSIGAVIPMAKALNLSQEELFGGYATLTGVTGNAAEVTTQLNGTLKGFLKPSKDMAAVMHQLGYETGAQMLKANGLEKSLLMLKTAVGNDENAFANLFGSIEGKKAVLALTGAQMDSMREKTKAMGKAVGLTDEAFKRQRDNVESLEEDIKNLMDNGLTQLGQVILPIVKLALQAIIPLLEFVADNSEILIPILAGVCAGFAAFSVVQSAKYLLDIYRASTIATSIANGGLVAALKAVWIAMASNPIGWICIAIGALIAIIVALVRHWDQVKEAMITVWNVCKDVFGKIGTFIKEHFVDALLIALGPLGAIIKGVQSLRNKTNGKGKGGDVPMLANGGFTNGVSIAGEDGEEAVISFKPSQRNKNIATWLKAGELLGVGASGSGSSSYNLGGFVFSPKIYVSEKMSADEVVSRIKEAEGEFCDIIDDLLARKAQNSYKVRSSAY